MNKVMSRAKMLIALVLCFSVGIAGFMIDYLLNSHKWVFAEGSPHIYVSGDVKTVGCGLIADRYGNLLADYTGDKIYSNDPTLRAAAMHWVGDREGNINASALSGYIRELAGYDAVNGLYAYDGIGGQANLTLSAKLQMAALEAMGQYRGTLAIINYKTGEILCAVTTPTFDPDHIPEDVGQEGGAYDGVYVNRFTQGVYIPGSIFKIVTLIAALECIPDLQQQVFTCTGELEYGIDKVTCEREHGVQDVREAFKNSCNCAFAKISEQIGGKRLARYAQELGILDSVEFDGIKTASGSIDSADQADVLVAWSAIGQHKDTVNPAGFLRLVSAIANGGMVQPMYLVDSITLDGESTYEADYEATERIMSSETAQTVQEFMRNNVENYYGDELFAGFTACAKSGTAQVGGGKKANAMFTGFLTDEEYPLAFIVAIEEGGYGRHTCIPVLEKVLQACRETL